MSECPRCDQLENDLIDVALERDEVVTYSARVALLLAAARDAFDECTGDYPKELVADEAWYTHAAEVQQVVDEART